MIRLQKLLRIKEVLEEQMQMVDKKMEKILEIKEDTHDYYERVCEAIKKYKEG